MTLEAGRELDAQIAEKIFGWIRRTTEANNEQLVTVPPDWTDFSTVRWWGHDINDIVPLYSSEIAAAWLVVERLTSQGWSVELSVTDDPPNVDVEIRDRPSGHQRAAEYAASAPLAICRAALLAVIRPHCWCDD